MSLAFGVCFMLVGVGVVVLAADSMLALDQGFAVRTIALALLGAAWVAWIAHRRLDAAFGTANVVTLLRAGFIAPLVGLIGIAPTPALAWFATGLGGVGLVLDGVDGYVARRTGQTTRFGARFDMETDTLLMLVLSVLCFALGKAGPWVLAAGTLRYAFIGAARWQSWMRVPLPPSRRRQTVCVVQMLALLACLSPPVSPPWSGYVAGVGLALLVWSFAEDVRWLKRQS